MSVSDSEKPTDDPQAPGPLAPDSPEAFRKMLKDYAGGAPQDDPVHQIAPAIDGAPVFDPPPPDEVRAANRRKTAAKKPSEPESAGESKAGETTAGETRGSGEVIELPKGRRKKAGEGPPRWQQPPTDDSFRLPPSCPVIPLGRRGDAFFFLTPRKEYVIRRPREMTKPGVTALFGQRVPWLWQNYPNFNKEGACTGWNVTSVTDQLVVACDELPIWDPAARRRGVGCWLGPEGELVVHTGRRLLINGEPGPPGVFGQHVYAAEPEWVDPDDGDGMDGRDAAAQLFELLGSWSWRRPLDARLLLGAIAAAFVAGALKVRPAIWVQGEKGTGKSSITGRDEGVVAGVFGRRIVATSDTTAAGLYQHVGHGSRLVAVDEIEGRADNRKAAAVIELMRQTYSGGAVLRGGAEHEGVEFRARFPVMFSSINIPPLKPQDLSRLALVRLGPLEDRVGLKVKDAELKRWGGAILNLWVAEWHRWPTYLEAWRGHLLELGHDSRGADQFGTLLAAADFILGDTPADAEDRHEIAAGMDPRSLAEISDNSSNAESCIAHLMSRRLGTHRNGSQWTAGEYVDQAARKLTDDGHVITPAEANRELARHGLAVYGWWVRGGQRVLAPVHKIPASAARDLVLAIANQGDGIIALFADSDWTGAPGAHNPWTAALDSLPGAERTAKAVRFGPSVGRAVLVPLHHCIVADDDDAAVTHP